VVVVDGAAADADGADDPAAVVFDRDAAGEGDEPVVGVLDAVERRAGLRHFAEVAGGHIEVARRLGLFDRDVDGAEPRLVHAEKRLEVGAGVYDGDVHIQSHLVGFAAGGFDDGLRLIGADVGYGVGHLLRAGVRVYAGGWESSK
jgi:hypothetical protein